MEQGPIRLLALYPICTQKGGSAEWAGTTSHSSGGFKGCKCTPLWWLVMYFFIHNCTSPSNDYAAVACSSGMQQQQPGTVHSRISSLLISRRLTRPRVASRYSARTFSYFKQLSYQYQSVATIITCVTNALMTGSGRGNPKIFGCASCARG